MSSSSGTGLRLFIRAVDGRSSDKVGFIDSDCDRVIEEEKFHAENVRTRTLTIMIYSGGASNPGLDCVGDEPSSQER